MRCGFGPKHVVFLEGRWNAFPTLSAHLGKLAIYTTIGLPFNCVSPTVMESVRLHKARLRVTHTPLPFINYVHRDAARALCGESAGRGRSPDSNVGPPEALAPTSDRSPHSLPFRIESEGVRGRPTLPPGRSSMGRSFLCFSLKGARTWLVADRFLDYSQNRPYPAKSDPKSIPFQGSARHSLSPIITGERHGGDEIRKRAHSQAGLEQRGVARVAKKGETRSLTRRIRTGFALFFRQSAQGRIRATPSLPSNKSGRARRLSFSITGGPS